MLNKLISDKKLIIFTLASSRVNMVLNNYKTLISGEKETNKSINLLHQLKKLISSINTTKKSTLIKYSKKRHRGKPST